MWLDLLYVDLWQIGAVQVAHSVFCLAQDSGECQSCDHVVHGISVQALVLFQSQLDSSEYQFSMAWICRVGESVHGSNGWEWLCVWLSLLLCLLLGYPDMVDCHHRLWLEIVFELSVLRMPVCLEFVILSWCMKKLNLFLSQWSAELRISVDFSPSLWLSQIQVLRSIHMIF